MKEGGCWETGWVVCRRCGIDGDIVDGSMRRVCWVVVYVACCIVVCVEVCVYVYFVCVVVVCVLFVVCVGYGYAVTGYAHCGRVV